VFITRYDKIRRIGLKVSVINHPLAIKVYLRSFSMLGDKLKYKKIKEIKEVKNYDKTVGI